MKIIIIKKYENSIGSEGMRVERACVEEELSRRRLSK